MLPIFVGMVPVSLFDAAYKKHGTKKTALSHPPIGDRRPLPIAWCTYTDREIPYSSYRPSPRAGTLLSRSWTHEKFPG